MKYILVQSFLCVTPFFTNFRPFTYHLLGYTFPSLTMYLFNIGIYTTRFITTDWRILTHHVYFQWFIAKPFF